LSSKEFDTPTADRTTNRFFAAPTETPARDASRQDHSRQDRLLRRPGRNPLAGQDRQLT
jgi:hypothetical protein